MKNSIKIKIFASICTIALAFVMILTLLNLFFYDDYYRYKRKIALYEIFQEIGSSYTGQIDYNHYTQIADLENKAGVRLTIIGDEGIKYDTILLQNNSGLFQPNERDWIFHELVIVNNAVAQADSQRLKEKGYAFVTVSAERHAESFLCLVGHIGDERDFIVVRVPYAQMKQNSSFNSIFLMITSLFSLLICILLSYFLSQQVTRPLLRINEVAEAMSLLDFSEKYEGTEKDEIGQLGQSINRLSEHLEEAIRDLQQSNRQLGDEIAEKEQIDALRQEFIINVSHELKTPIALIQGYAEGLRLGVAENVEDQSYYCETIVDEAARMNRMVMELLQLSKLELGREKAIIEEVDLYTLCRDIVQKTEVLWREKQQKVLCDAAKLIVHTDEDLLEQVITNYLTNAIRYAPVGGNITLRAVQENDGPVTLFVFNEGEGLPAEELSKIWGKFYRSDKARTRTEGGTGIGLSIVRAVADTLGADCGVENIEGGIEFWFRIPPKMEENRDAGT